MPIWRERTKPLAECTTLGLLAEQDDGQPSHFTGRALKQEDGEWIVEVVVYSDGPTSTVFEEVCRRPTIEDAALALLCLDRTILNPELRGRRVW
ncbi:MAG: hypothetical protein PF961_16550 [Planctomycetota bacterium]|jgi:hypothetical protein|nr:hypothetical protein [Planctomycetota bacterium]